MALILNEEEEQFRQSVRRFVAERSPLTKLRELMSSGQPYDADVWKQVSALGLTGLIIPAEHGGADLGVLRGRLQAGAHAADLLRRDRQVREVGREAKRRGGVTR